MNDKRNRLSSYDTIAPIGTPAGENDQKSPSLWITLGGTALVAALFAYGYKENYTGTPAPKTILAPTPITQEFSGFDNIAQPLCYVEESVVMEEGGTRWEIAQEHINTFHDSEDINDVIDRMANNTAFEEGRDPDNPYPGDKIDILSEGCFPDE